MKNRYEFRRGDLPPTFLNGNDILLYRRFSAIADIILDHKEKLVLKNRLGSGGSEAYCELMRDENTHTLTAPMVFFDRETDEVYNPRRKTT